MLNDSSQKKNDNLQRLMAKMDITWPCLREQLPGNQDYRIPYVANWFPRAETGFL